MWTVFLKATRNALAISFTGIIIVYEESIWKKKEKKILEMWVCGSSRIGSQWMRIKQKTSHLALINQACHTWEILLSTEITATDQMKYLGTIFNNNLKWDKDIDFLLDKLWCLLSEFRFLRNYFIHIHIYIQKTETT